MLPYILCWREFLSIGFLQLDMARIWLKNVRNLKTDTVYYYPYIFFFPYWHSEWAYSYTANNSAFIIIYHMTRMTTQNSSTSNNLFEFQNPFILTYYILLSIYETQSFKLLINLLRILLLHVLNKSIFQLPIGLITIYYNFNVSSWTRKFCTNFYSVCCDFKSRVIHRSQESKMLPTYK